MRDTIKLQTGNKEISTFLSYDVDSNALVPADAFTCKISRIDNSITAGQEFKLTVNGQTEMVGVIDKVEPSYSKGTEEMTIEGRDYMGLLVDASVTEWKTLKGLNLKDLAGRLLKNIPYIDKSKIVYGKEVADSGLSKEKKTKKESVAGIFDDTSSDVCQYEPGISIFEALSDYSQRHGLLMWMEPDGSLVFGELKGAWDSESPGYSFYLYKAGDGRKKNNIISARRTDDISKRYSKVTAIAQIQGTDSFDAGGHTITKTAEDKFFPFSKPLVLQSQCSSSKAAEYQVQNELKKREAEGWRVEITAAGHSQDGLNYRANRVCYIKDELLNLDGAYLVLGRKFSMDRQAGPRTVLTIGKLMEGYAIS